MSSPRRSIPPMILLLAVVACGAGDRAGFDIVVRDSAGIEIVENGATRAGHDVAWIAEEAVTIGMLEGPEEYTFNRIGDVRVTDAGAVYVLDAGDNVVKVYDTAGGHRRTFGGEGEGPAEFRRAGRLALRGDTYEIRIFRIAVSPDGEARSAEDGFPTPLRIIRRPSAPLELTPADVAAYRDRILHPERYAPDRDMVQAYEAAWDTIGFPATWPAFDRVLWDDEDRIWVRRPAGPEAERREWDVFDVGGRYIGAVGLPGDLEVHAVVAGVVWGTIRDELDVQYVRGYRLSEPGSSPVEVE